MHNLRYFVVLPAAVSFVCLAGCEAPVADSNEAVAQSTQPAPARQARIGTINVARIYNLTGLQNQRNAKLRELNQKRVDLDTERNEAMQKKIKEFGDDPEKLTDEEKQELQQMQSAWVTARREKTAEAQQVMRETDQFLNNIYHQQTSEPIRKIAEARGLDVVLVMQRNLFAYVNPEVDITDEVLKQMDITAAPPETSPPVTDLPIQNDNAPPEEPSPEDPAQEKTATDETPTDETPKDETPKDETPKDETPKDETLKDKPAKEEPRKEEPAKEEPQAADEDTTVPSQEEESAAGDDTPAPG